MKFAFVISLLLIPVLAFTQTPRCASLEYERHIEREYPQFFKLKEEFNKALSDLVSRKKIERANASTEEEIYRIPVVVHVIHNTKSGNTGGTGNVNISDEQILSQIQVLNEDYRRQQDSPGFNSEVVGSDTKIEFCLATRDPDGMPSNGIVRVYADKSQWNISDDQYFKGLSYWPSDKYLNIWVLNLRNPYLGYAQFPPAYNLMGIAGPFDAKTDGVVIDFEAFGTTGTAKSPYNRGRTLTHEVGHWLGLLHINGDIDGSQTRRCGSDYVEDTPPDARLNETGTCSDSSDCGQGFKPDMVNNYMDYSNDICMNIFTIGQKNRMRTVIETVKRRSSLINSIGCCGGNILTNIPYLHDFESNTFSQEGWEIYSPSGNSTKKINPGAFNTSNSSFKITPSGVFSGDTSTNKNFTFIESPYLYLANGENPVVSFDMAYAGLYEGSETDSLVISCQSNCGKWKSVASYSGNDLLTTSRKSSDFSPSFSEWKTFFINLPDLALKTVGRVRLEFYSKGINNVYVDNINIHETTNSLSVTPYPNPVKESVTLKVTFEGEKDITIEVFSVLGQAVYSESIKNTRSFSHPTDVSSLNEGIYIIRISEGKNHAFSRIVVKR